MDFSISHFYKLTSKKKLYSLLFIKDDKELESIVNNYKVYISKQNEKKRLVEEPNGKLKEVQRRVKKLFDRNISYNLPNYILCKKNCSWIDIARIHCNSQTIVSLDISKFFPSIDFEMIVKLFTKHFKTSSIVAIILARILTIDYGKIIVKDEVRKWFLEENEKRKINIPLRHLCTGASTSVIVSELACYDMFEEIYSYCQRKEIIFTSYVDDIQLSKVNHFSRIETMHVIKTIRKYGFVCNDDKMKVFLFDDDAVLPGVIRIKKTNRCTITKKMENKIIRIIEDEGKNFDNRFIGLMNVIKQIDENKYNYYCKLAFCDKKQISI